jgi:N-acetylglucosamine-6-phosphate deacetylase
VLLAGQLLFEGALAAGRLEISDGILRSVELTPELSAEQASALPILAPGLIDLHIHGFGGKDPLADLEGMATALALSGTTSFQPTLFPAAPDQLGKSAAACHSQSLALKSTAARVLGLHLEGPFVNPLAAGALPLRDLAEPSVSALRAILGPATGDGRGIRTITLAPELTGAKDLIAELEIAGVRASFGHSRATAGQARAALRKPTGSARFGITHLYNAMGGLHHRDPGLASLALTEDALVVELIGDLVHVGPEAIDLALRARGPAGIALVSDALEGAGTGCDVFHSHGRKHFIRDGAAWYAKGGQGDEPGQLAGSATGLLQAVQRLSKRGVVTLAEALTMATLAPARALGMEREIGVLLPGAKADLIALDPQGHRLMQVWIAGVEIPLANT